MSSTYRSNNALRKSAVASGGSVDERVFLVVPLVEAVPLPLPLPLFDRFDARLSVGDSGGTTL